MEKVFPIALNTFRESVRSKVLHSVLLFAVVVVLASSFFGTVTIGDQAKVVKDFGLFSISWFCVIYTVISGSALLYKELSRKTIYNILAKSVRRWEFICGKSLGMLLTVTAMLLLMGAGLSTFMWILERQFDSHMLVAYLQIFFQLMFVCACAIFFSSIVVTPMLGGACTFAAFLAGRSTEYVLQFARSEGVSGLLKDSLLILSMLLPPLDRIDVSNQAVYGLPVPLSHVTWSFLQAVGYSGTLLILAVLLFSRREFN